MSAVDLSGYPPAPVLWISRSLDLLCDYTPLQCQAWREHVPFWKEWFAYKVDNVTEILPNMLSYQEFLDGRDSSVNLAYEYAFQTPSTSLANLTTPTALLTVLALVLCFRLIKSVLLPIFSQVGRRAGRLTHGPDWEAHNEIRIVKFGEYVFRLLYHTCISIFGIWYFSNAPWWVESTKVLWVNYPHHDVSPGMTWYYLVQSAYNLEALSSLLEMSFAVTLKPSPSLTWSKDCRGDFREMAIHHVVTNLLIIGSSFFRFTRIGSMVFLVHDISDIPVDLSKLANFLKWKRATTACFATMCVAWLVLRLGILPFVIYKSVLWESMLLLNEPLVKPVEFLAYRWFFYYLVGQIILLHVAWFFMFLRMGFLLLKKGEAHDLSEHKRGEQQCLYGTDSMNGDAMNGKANMNGTSGMANGTNGKKTH